MDFVRPSELALHGNVAENWRRFKQRLMLYLEATEKATKPDKLKVAILLNFIGEEALEVFNTFHLKEDEAENFDLVINKFDDFCEPKKNVIFERFKFFSATQKDGESIDSFITELKGLSTSCEFESQKDSLIRDRIVYGIHDKVLKERLLREPNLTLLKAIEMCKTDKISKQQIKIMQNNQNICQIRKYEKKHSPKRNQESEKEFKCQRCGKSHRAKNCPAWGKRCSKCKKMNHFAAFCKSSAIRSLNDETEETVWSIHEAKVVHTLEWKKSIIVNGKEICFKLDSGAEVNVLPYTFTRQMKGLEIFQTNRKLTSYTGHEIKIKGIATLNCKTKNKTESLEFFIADGYYQPILGIEAIEKLSLIKKCDAVQTEQNNSAKEILNRHKNIFEGIGRLPIEHKIRLNENTTPVIAPSRKIPFSIREKVKAELERMEKLDIIEKVEEPSEWTHPIVVVQKPSGDVRICMDPRELNKYVQRERYILPTAETIFSELKGATVFSVFDASSAFWQVPLDKESTNLCTIATPFGRFRFKRLPYGLNSASEVFQRCINNILSGLQGTACYMDDILIYGNTMEEHNRNLETVLRRLEENNVKLNAKKQQIAVDKVNFLGHIISRDGIAIQASRAEAIQKLKRPENKTEVQRFLGMVTYLGKFIPNLSDKTAPLRKLISNKSEWKFGGEENDCFEKLKNMVSNAPILTFFDPTKPITISSDASQYGIGTVLMQGGQAIEYASFSLNATQRKYAQIEKELLAIVFGCERFQYYIWGNDVIVETDHKPLLSIVKKPLEKLSPRLQRMVLRLMRFQISLKFTPGKNMFVADHLSRDPLKDEVDTSYLEGQTESVHMLLVTTDEKIKRLQKETHGDHTLIQLIEYAKNGWPKYKTKVCDEAKPYWQFQDEIHVSDGIVYKGNCILVPSTLRKEILQVVHSSHQGIAASKEKARSAFYWPGMITQVENEVEKCRTCQEYSRKNPEESRIAHEIPEFPWEKIAVDFMEVSGTSSILVVDYHSKFVEIRKLSSKRETETIMQLKTIFRTHGIPRTLVSDNGPPFNSTGFKNFAQKYEFKHQTSSPKYPRSNGQVERTIQTIKGLIIKAVKSGRDPNLALMEFNNTPKYDLPSPTQMLMGRSVRTLSTYTRQQLKPLFDTTKNYQKLRDHQQKYAGSPKRILRPLEVGDNIMLQERHRKWVPATVTAKHETPRSYMVKTPSGSEYRRNRSHLRPRKFSVEDSAPTSQSPSIPGSQAGTAMDDNIQDHGRPTSENRRAYDPRENVAKKGEESSTSPSVRTRSGRTDNSEVDKMIEADVIQPSENPWASPVVLVKKKDGSWRFRVDYRGLNKITKKDVYPLPRINDALDCLREARMYSTMDLKTGYWQIEIDEEDREKTAFITPDGLFEFKPVTNVAHCTIVKNLDESPCSSLILGHLQELLEGTRKGLNWIQRKKLTCLFCQYEDVFATSTDDVGRTNVAQHRIDTGGATPVKQLPRRLPMTRRNEVDKLIEEMTEQDVIEPSSNPWASLVVIVKKKDGSHVSMTGVVLLVGYCRGGHNGQSGFRRELDSTKGRGMLDVTSDRGLIYSRAKGVTELRRSRRLQGREPILQPLPQRIEMEDDHRPIVNGSYLPCQRQRDPSTFSGDGNMNPGQWLKEYERVSKYNRWDETMKLANVVFYLNGTAGRWFDNNEESLNSWRSFEDAFRGVFGLQEDSARRAEEVLKSRAQKAEESSESYIQEILSLCHQVNPRMEEDDLAGLIRSIVREEIQKVFSAPEVINPLREVNALEQTVREEVSRALQPTRPQVNVVQQQPRTPYYNIDRPTQPRKTEHWRTYDDKPICFHCGRPGHVVRYCRERRQVFAEARTRNGGEGRNVGFSSRPPRYDADDDYVTPQNLDVLLPELFPTSKPRKVASPKTIPVASPSFQPFSQASECEKLSGAASNGVRSPLRKILQDKFRRELKTPLFKEPGPILKAANKNLIETIGKCVLNIVVNGLNISFEFVVMVECSHDIIFGWDFFKATEAVIDCGRNELHLGETSVLESREEENQRLFASDDFVIPPKSIKEINALCGIVHRFTTAYHPQTNGLTERFNKTLGDMLSMYTGVEQKDWDQVLPYVTFAYNTAKQEATGYTPFFLVHARKAETYIDAVLPYLPDEISDDYVGELVTRAEEARQLSRSRLLQSQAKDRRLYDQKHTPVYYQKDDLVWVFTPIRKVGLSEKLLKRYFGPYRVTKKLSEVTYEVEPVDPSPRSRKAKDIVHVIRMKPYLDPEEQHSILLGNTSRDNFLPEQGLRQANQRFASVSAMSSFEQRANIKFCVKLKSFTETLALMNEAYEDEKLSRTQVFSGINVLKDGRKSIADDSRSDRPLTSTTDRNIGQVRDLIVADKKLLLIIYQKYQEFRMGVTINKQAYKEILVRLRDAIRRKRNQLFKSKQWKLLHDNAPAHRAIIVQDYLAKHSVSDPHPPYSPDIAPCDFFFFPKLKMTLKGRRFSSSSE
ncbi:K02A2.6-like, partial [Cordylochernes scorpioides]